MYKFSIGSLILNNVHFDSRELKFYDFLLHIKICPNFLYCTQSVNTLQLTQQKSELQLKFSVQHTNMESFTNFNFYRLQTYGCHSRLAIANVSIRRTMNLKLKSADVAFIVKAGLLNVKSNCMRCVLHCISFMYYR